MRALETECRANAEESGIAGNKGGDAEASTGVSGVDDIIFAEEIIDVGDDLPAAAVGEESGANIAEPEAVLAEDAAEVGIVVIEEVLRLVLVARRQLKTTREPSEWEKVAPRA